MEVVSERRFEFAVPPEQLWAALGATDQYRAWWPWLRGFEAEGLVAGDTWRCVVQPPLPYRLRFTIELAEVVAPRLVSAAIAGDITGTARLSIEPTPTGSAVRLESRLAPANRPFTVLASLMAPLVRRGHDWVLDTGAAQFADRVRERSA